MIDKPPIGGKELHSLSAAQLAGFRLHPGPVSNRTNNFLITDECSTIKLLFTIFSYLSNIDT